MMAWIDGQLVAGAEVPRPDVGRFAPFETMGASTAQVPLWPRHLQRLEGAARRLGLPFTPPDDLRAGAAELLLATGHADGILRLAMLPVGDVVHFVMTTRLRSPASTVRLLPTVVERPDSAPPGDLKAQPRGYYDAVLQQAQDGGADDGIVVDANGRVLQTATANLWLRLDGAWATPALDGGVLPGIARALLLEAGLEASERALDLGDLHRADAIAVSNAVYGPRAAALQNVGRPDTAAVAPLRALWDRAR